MSYTLSYIIATRNRLPFLKITLLRLIDELQPDEEVVVVDGNSTDGSKEYLQTLFEEGKIHQFVSEPDKNQAHAWNKAMLMANGVIIKKIIDDDVFCYESIRLCKNYMLQNPAVDVVLSNDLFCLLSDPAEITRLSRFSQFQKWNKGLVKSFTFGDVHMLIRRQSLSFIGLYNTSFVFMDWEYSLRISYLQSKIGYFTGYNALSVAHPQTVSSLTNRKLYKSQGKRGQSFYEYDGDEIGLWSKIKIFVGKLIARAKQPKKEITLNSHEMDLISIYDQLYSYTANINKSITPSFLESS